MEKHDVRGSRFASVRVAIDVYMFFLIYVHSSTNASAVRENVKRQPARFAYFLESFPEFITMIELD